MLLVHSYQRIGKRTRGLKNERESRDNPNYCIAEIGQSTEKSPGDLSRLVVIQIPVKDHQLMLMWKTPIIIRGQNVTIQTTAVLRLTRILRRVLETWADLLSLIYLQVKCEELKSSHLWSWHYQARWKKKLRKNIPGKPESYSRQNYMAETISKELIPGLYPL